MTEVTDRAWLTLAGTKGIGPKTLARLAISMAERELSLLDIVRPDHRETEAALSGIGLREDLAEAAAERLAESMPSLHLREGVSVMHPDTAGFPQQLLKGRLAFPAAFYFWGNQGLLTARGAAVVGSRDTPDEELEFTHTLAGVLANRGWNIVSGHARGVDHAAHVGATEAGGTTTIVLPEGINRFSARRRIPADPHSVLVISQFDPDAGWAGHRAMTRNSTIAALAEVVVVVRSGESGGTREMIRLCSTSGKPVVALKRGLPDEAAPEVDLVVEQDAEDVADAIEKLSGSQPATRSLF